MKKAAGLLTVFLAILCGLQAQRKSPRFFAELSGGPSFPLGQFAERSYNGPLEEDQPGMASIGVSANITAGYYLKKNFGVLLTAGYSTNKQKETGYREYMEKNNPAAYPSVVDVETNRWKIYKVMAGGFFITPLVDDKLNLITKLSAGIFTTARPSYNWANSGIGLGGLAYSIGWVGKEKLPASFCYQVGLGLQYKLNPQVHLLLDLNSFNATTKKDYSFTTMPFPNAQTTITNKYRFGSVNGLLGLGLSF